MLPAEAEEALAELVALGLVNSDSFAGLRALLLPAASAARGAARRRRDGVPCSGWPMRAAGPSCARTTGARPAPRRGGHRARGEDAARALGSDVLEAPGARGGVAAAVARSSHVLPPPGSPRRDPGRPVRRRFSGEQYARPEAVRPAARRAPPAPHRTIRVALGRRSAQSGRHRHPGRAAACDWRAIDSSIATVCRSPLTRPARFISRRSPEAEARVACTDRSAASGTGPRNRLVQTKTSRRRRRAIDHFLGIGVLAATRGRRRAGAWGTAMQGGPAFYVPTGTGGDGTLFEIQITSHLSYGRDFGLWARR